MNSYRISVASATGYYKYIEDVFQENHPISEETRLFFTNKSFDHEQFVRKLGHQFQDLVKDCKFRGRDCGPENFTSIITGLGMCYSLKDELVVSESGLDHGLQLQFNMELFEVRLFYTNYCNDSCIINGVI